jgi:uncharacterized membrane-anchored protein
MKKYFIIFFPLMCAAQWIVPGQMIIEQENILKNGRAYHFKSAPVDPSDPFRGKYLTLNFRGNQFISKESYSQGEKVYVVLGEDSRGFARIDELRKIKPTKSENYFQADVRYSYDSIVFVDFPFDRFYVEESKAKETERIYSENNRMSDSTQTTYAIVRVLNGKTSLEDVIINNRSIIDIMKELNDK